MFRVNRPFRLGKFIKLRINKKSLGLTVGNKYIRSTINTKGDVTTSAGGAGTGLYLSKSTNLIGKNKKSSESSPTRCESLTKSGARCKNTKYNKANYCRTHLTTSPNALNVKIKDEKKGIPVFTYDDLNEKSTQNLKNLGSRLNEIEGTLKIFTDETLSIIQAKYGDFNSLDPQSKEYKNSIIEFQNALKSKPGYFELNAEQVDIYKQILVWEDKVLDSIICNNFENIYYDAQTLRKNFQEVIDNL